MSQVKTKSTFLDQVNKQIKIIDDTSEDWSEMSLARTSPLSSRVIDAKSRFLYYIGSVSDWETASPYETVMQEIAELRLENRRLAKKVVNLEKRINVLEKELPEEDVVDTVIVLREITRDKAKAEILNLFSTGRTLYYSEIAKKLQLDLEVVVDICNELMNEGEISCADST